jgi:hypothetical protein
LSDFLFVFSFLCVWGGGGCSCVCRYAGIADTRARTPLGVRQYLKWKSVRRHGMYKRQLVDTWIARLILGVTVITV